MLARLKSEIRNPHPSIILLLICVVAFALRLGPLFGNRFHPDEALFSTWALKIARGENLLLSGVAVDKPPLLIYLMGLSYFIFGQSELAARVPNLIASVISVPLLYQLARRSYPADENAALSSTPLRPVQPVSARRRAGQNAGNDELALVAALFLALSPFAILFAPTAFLDPMMVMFGLASLVAASRGRAGWAGVLLGLSFATKVQGLFFIPLIPVFWNRQANREAPSSISPSLYPFVRLILGFVLIASSVLIWDRTRGGLPFWVQQTINYGDIRIIYAAELGPRLGGWLSFLPYFWGPLVGLIGLIGLPLLLYRDFCGAVRTRAAWIDLWLLAYTIGFLALHWLLAFPLWDRYLLILVPILALLMARVVRHLVSPTPRHLVAPSLAFSIIILAFMPFSVVAAHSGYPIGGDHGANDGIEQVAGYLKSLPSGTVVYDHWLAWELGYYVGDGFAYLSYFDTPSAVADDLRVFASDDNRYIIFPASEAPDKVIDAIGLVGYTLTPVLQPHNRFGEASFTVYRIMKRTA